MSRTGIPPRPPPEPQDELPYSIELWQAEGGAAIERVLARASSAQLAHAVFAAARTEHPGRRITLRQGSRIIAEFRRLTASASDQSLSLRGAQSAPRQSPSRRARRPREIASSRCALLAMTGFGQTSRHYWHPGVGVDEMDRHARRTAMKKPPAKRQKPHEPEETAETVKQVRDQQHTGSHDRPEEGGSDRFGATRAGAGNVEPKRR